jgi:endonuclease G
MSRQRNSLLGIILIISVLLLCAYVRPRLGDWIYRLTHPDVTKNSPPGNLDPALGNPSAATTDPNNKNNYLLVKRQYVLSYNNDKGEPNWVAWYLQSSDIGNAERQNNFHPETALPEGFKRVTPGDYTGTGYDRGHVCNSKDRTATEEDNSETFSMANMLPQTPDLNRQVWESLESYSRTLAQQGNRLYIIAGGYGSAKMIGRANKVNVPTNCWKIVVVLPPGSGDITQMDKNTRVIAVDMPNVQGIANDSWQKYVTTVRDIEQKTGYQFFTKSPPDVREAIETKRDSGS